MAVFRLAMLLGKTVSELNMSWREFCYWQAYLHMEPPEKAADTRTASLLAQITNMSGRSLPAKKMVSADHFLRGSEPKQQSMEQQIAFMKSLNGNTKNGG